MPLYGPLPPDLEKLKQMPQPEPIEGGHVISALLKALDVVAPGFRRSIERLASGAYEDAGISPLNAVADALGAPEDPTGGFGMPATIQWTPSKEYPKAFLHRAIGDPTEIDMWRAIFGKRINTEKPASIVTPTVTGTFGSEPYGLMFSVKDPKKISHSAPYDMWTMPDPVKKREITTQKWTPDPGAVFNWADDPAEIPKKFRSLDEFLGKQKEIQAQMNRGLADETDRLPGIEPYIRGNHNRLNHSEVIAALGLPEFEGVRLPPRRQRPDPYDAEYDWLYEELGKLAKETNKPIYRFPSDVNAAQHAQGLQNPWAGDWTYNKFERSIVPVPWEVLTNAR